MKLYKAHGSGLANRNPPANNNVTRNHDPKPQRAWRGALSQIMF